MRIFGDYVMPIPRAERPSDFTCSCRALILLAMLAVFSTTAQAKEPVPLPPVFNSEPRIGEASVAQFAEPDPVPLPPKEEMEEEFSTQPYDLPVPSAEVQELMKRVDALEKEAAGKGGKAESKKEEKKEEPGWVDLSGEKWTV